MLLQKEGSCSGLGRILGGHRASRTGADDGYIEVVHVHGRRTRAWVLTFSRELLIRKL
jgi:hypothetical protein